MTIAYWCILLMVVFPYFFIFLAKSNPDFNNYKPREYLEKLTGWRKRASYIQINSFESTPIFAIAVIIAQLQHAPLTIINSFAISFVIARILYAICYLTNKATLRSLFWTLTSIL